MPEPASSSARAARKALAGRLQDIRKAAGLTARQLSDRAGWHESKTSKIENAKQPASASDIRTWVQVCSAQAQTGELLDQLRALDEMWLDWRRAEKSGFTRINLEVRQLYESTRLLRVYSGMMIPTPVQTADYVTALLQGLKRRRDVPVDDIPEAVAERMARQHTLYDGDHRFVVLLEEEALRKRIGGPGVLAAQLRHLLAVQPLPSLALGVIPADADRSLQWPVEMFFLFDRKQVSVELVSGFLTITNPREIAMYEADFLRFSEIAVYGQAARALIESALTSLR